MSRVSKVTKDDFDVIKSDMKYGPCWIIVSKEKSYVKYCLKSTAAMVEEGYIKSPMVHLNTFHGDDPHRNYDWKGVYRTGDMDEAFSALVDDINRNKELEVIQEALGEIPYVLRRHLDEIDDATENFTRKNIEEIMGNIEASFAALKDKYDTILEEIGND